MPFHPWPSSQHHTAGTQLVFSVGAGAGANEDAVGKVVDREGALSMQESSPRAAGPALHGAAGGGPVSSCVLLEFGLGLPGIVEMPWPWLHGPRQVLALAEPQSSQLYNGEATGPHH